MAQPTEYEQLSSNSPDGSQWGRTSTEKIGFYGTAPVVKPTISGSVSSGAGVSSIAVALATVGLAVNSLTA
jgi:hypothetical protein